MSSPRRLDQILASHGYGSRSFVREWIEEGRVTVNGKIVDDIGKRVLATDVRLDGEPLDHPEGLLVIFHKPVGLVCSHDQREGPRIYDRLPSRWLDRNPVPSSVGRLDKDSSGLILVTDHLHLIHKLTSPKHKVEKTYRVSLSRPCPEEAIAQFASGALMLEGETTPCAPARLTLIDELHADVVMTEGRFRQVRRMFASIGVEVLTLQRTQFGPWTLGDLEEGCWRDAEPHPLAD
jgi:16S rRNA pseudouridine516 synthase